MSALSARLAVTAWSSFGTNNTKAKMDRKIIYPGAIPLETDLLHTNKNAMMAVGRLAESLLGAETQYAGLGVSPTPVPSLGIIVSPGTVYAKMAADVGTYSSLPADATQVLKQGALATAVTLAVTAPTTSGYAVDYLIQVALSEVDVEGTVLPYYNASNPSQAFAGPGNSGAAQPTMRKCIAVVSAIAGAPAPAGSQTPPPPMAGAVGIAVVTVNFGDAVVLSGAIRDAAGTPRIKRMTGFAPIDSPEFTGAPKVPTAAPGDATTKAASTAFVAAAVAQMATVGDVNEAVAEGFEGSHQLNGYQKLPGGLIMQWGKYVGGTDTATITFPIPFPNACLNVQGTSSNTSSDSEQNVKAWNYSAAGFTIRALGNERPAHWFAIGH